ncbi:outer membrane receptor protein involved in Fe transport [Gelidibacter sediminis]|uniref:Outer membrane receptor protein involved in Fe transport n=1 Tax=Gelidibacter sediminis TaxID=1608710 RepID=A0A4R7Q960_9FLAO|nr:TonB-dependent receptor [Gelidibacter sediminis]TDU43280.1 outer membrane receptor protein involved in Fe transport [Gelidibacter sediminis]
MKHLLTLLTLVFTSVLSAQSTASIAGKLIDKEYNNEPLAFGNVLIKGTTIGTTSDMDGVYHFDNLDEGLYTLVYSFVGYETKELEVVLEAGKEVNVDVEMFASSASLDEVVITTTTRKESETALLLDQKNAIEIKQSIGSEELSRKGISDVASAVVKTTGVSKQEGSNTIYVRGLGDRYNSTSLNGLPITSNDPEKKNISLDLFSTDIVEFISIDKVYGPKISGDFAGGNVDITSINYKGKGMLEVNLGSTMGTNALDKFNDFQLQDGPNRFGFSNYGVPNNPLNGYNFENKLAPVKEKPIGSALDLKAGKSFSIGEEGSLNLFATASFDNGFEYRDGINQSVSAQGAKLKSFNQERFSYNTNTTGMFNANYRLNSNHKIAYNFLTVNSSSQTKDGYKGFIRDIAEDNNGLIQRSTYIQNTLMIHQLLGNHKLSDKLDFDWATSYNKVEGDMPDRTQNTLKYSEDANGYVFAQNTITDNHRYYQNLVEDELAANLSVSYRLNEDENGVSKGKATLGYNGRFKNRDFEAIQFNFRISGSELNSAVNPDNLDAFLNKQNYSNGLFGIESFAGLTPQTYDGEQLIHAGFASLEYNLSDKLSAVAGLRFERVEQTVSWRTQLDASGKNNTFNRNEFLPSVILKYELNEKQNLRFGASKTYTLPQFKERALFIYEDVTEVKVGNPDLYPSQNYNVDLKWEVFPKNSELFSVTAFGKYILDPINEITLASSTNDISFINTGDSGYVYGAEIEIRKDLFNFDVEESNTLSAGLNASFMQTHQELDSEKVRQETNYNTNLTNDTSGFTGASDRLLNADLSYIKSFKNDGNLMATLAYSYTSDKIYALGVETKGNLVDKGVGTLDFILKTKINKHFGIDLTVKNILNPAIERIQENASEDITVLSFKRGAFFKLGLRYKL